MKVGDLVRLSGDYSRPAVVQDWGFGLIDAVYEPRPGIDGYGEVEVIWPKKAFTSRTMPKSRVEVINESL